MIISVIRWGGGEEKRLKGLGFLRDNIGIIVLEVMMVGGEEGGKWGVGGFEIGMRAVLGMRVAVV